MQADSWFRIVFISLTFICVGHNTLLASKTPQEVLEERPQLFQIRLSKFSRAFYEKDATALEAYIEKFKTIVAEVLEVDPTKIYFKRVTRDPAFAAQFSVVPATNTELAAYTKKWVTAVASLSPVLLKAFPDFDTSYPPIHVKTSTTTAGVHTGPSTPGETEKPTSSKTPLIVGSFISGAVLLSAVVGAGYYYKKSKCSQATEQSASPTAGMHSPDGVTNGHMQGERTPNHQNFV